MLFENSLYRLLSIDQLGDICGDSQKDWEKIFFSFLHFALDSSFSPTKDSQVTFQNFSGWFCCFYVLDTLSITIDTYSISQEHKTHWIGSWALPRWKLFCRRVKKWNRMELSEPFSKYHLAFSILSCISTDRGRGGRVKEVRSRKFSQHFFSISIRSKSQNIFPIKWISFFSVFHLLSYTFNLHQGSCGEMEFRCLAAACLVSQFINL